MMYRVSVITPTIRLKGLELVRSSLKKQTFKDFEWLVGSKFNPQIEEARWVHDNYKDGYWSLNRIYSDLINSSKGSIIISWQDWVYSGPDAIEKFVINLEKLGKKSLVSGVGHQYSRLNKYGKPTNVVWIDPRINSENGSLYECYHNDCEWNFCAAWKSDLEYIGGPDTKLDFIGLGGDMLQVTDRMNDAGFKFYLDQSNKSFSLKHDRSDFGGQEEWDKKHILFAKDNGTSLYDKRKLELKQQGKWPIL